MKFEKKPNQGACPDFFYARIVMRGQNTNRYRMNRRRVQKDFVFL